MNIQANPGIFSPALVLDKSKCINNIKRMAEKVSQNHLRFRPHFKTHQSAELDHGSGKPE